MERSDWSRGSAAQRREGRIVTREKKENNEVWTVEGLVQPGLKRTLFTFREGFLVAIELQYEYPDWTIERYNERMGEIRRYFDAKFGTGKLVSRSRDTDTDVIQTLVGYQWMIGSTMLELFYFSAQRDALLFRTITRRLQKSISERRLQLTDLVRVATPLRFSFCIRFNRLARLAFAAELIRSINRMPLR